jgi:RNA polymerase sigma-70 factor (ECF subfamily)
MARNFCIDEARKGRFRKTESLNEKVNKDDDGGDERLDRVASEVPQQDRLADNTRLRKVIDEAVKELPDEQREVFLLREMSGLQFKDIADLTGVGENTVKSRMRYALAALQKHLQAAGFTGGAAALGAAQPAGKAGDAAGSGPGPPTTVR